MKLSKSFGKTVREAPADADMISHQLLIRANFIRSTGAGIYTFMPFGYRVIRKIWAIMSDEMDKINGQELWMPNLHPAPLWQATGRWDSVDVLFKLKTGSREYALSATHEEIVVDLALREISSYRDMPQMIYHISKKFRDERRARGGLIRLREFVMKDAYSLDVNEAALDEYYPEMVQAYFNIFERCGVTVTAVNADSGNMGGTASQEFVVIHEQGEDSFIACDNCDYAANVEAASFVREGEKPSQLNELVKVLTPNCKTIAQVAAFIGVETSQTNKAVFYWWTMPGKEENGRFVFGLTRGDLDINETKLRNALGGGELRAATEEEIIAISATPGYASPIGLNVAKDFEDDGVLVIADPSIEAGGNFVVGANDHEYHFTGANYPRDFAITTMADIAQAETGHHCPQCDGRITAHRAIEAGHCFKLGTRYSEAVEATFLDENGRPQPIFMGSYGIGLDRLLAIIVEEHHDKNGIIWPAEVAPYDIHLLHIGKDEEVLETAVSLYTDLQKAGFDVLYDDRNARPGFKFKDADLIGLPWRVTVGKRGLAEGNVEVKKRDADERQLIPVGQLIQFLIDNR